jgi:hypothetical protein
MARRKQPAPEAATENRMDENTPAADEAAPEAPVVAADEDRTKRAKVVIELPDGGKRYDF